MQNVFALERKAGTNYRPDFAVCGCSSEEKSGRILQLVCCRAVLMVGKFFAEKERRDELSTGFCGLLELFGGKVGTDIATGLLSCRVDDGKEAELKRNRNGLPLAERGGAREGRQGRKTD